MASRYGNHYISILRKYKTEFSNNVIRTSDNSPMNAI